MRTDKVSARITKRATAGELAIMQKYTHRRHCGDKNYEPRFEINNRNFSIGPRGCAVDADVIRHMFAKALIEFTGEQLTALVLELNATRDASQELLARVTKKSKNSWRTKR